MPQRIEVSAKPIERPELVLPPVDQVRMREVEWVLITPDNFEEVVSIVRGEGRPVVFFALRDNGYENLGMNFSDIRALVQQQQQIIIAYENYYKASGNALDEAETQRQQQAAQAAEAAERSKRINFNLFNQRD